MTFFAPTKIFIFSMKKNVKKKKKKFGVSRISLRSVRLSVNTSIGISEGQTFVLDNEPMHMRAYK